jgi:hypothetical protein
VDNTVRTGGLPLVDCWRTGINHQPLNTEVTEVKDFHLVFRYFNSHSHYPIPTGAYMYNFGLEFVPLFGEGPDGIFENVLAILGTVSLFIISFVVLLVKDFVVSLFEDKEDKKFKNDHPEAWAENQKAKAESKKASRMGCLVVAVIILVIMILLFK